MARPLDSGGRVSTRDRPLPDTRVVLRVACCAQSPVESTGWCARSLWDKLELSPIDLMENPLRKDLHAFSYAMGLNSGLGNPEFIG
jgi:hypothetical protein